MSYTYTRSHTRTGTREVASRVAADLDLARIFYQLPTAEWIALYEDEVDALLSRRYLSQVEYGFQRGDARVVSLRYVANYDGTLTASDDAGSVFARANVSGAQWYSHLWYARTWWDLSEREREAVRRILPFQRATGAAPADGRDGYWVIDKTYGAEGSGVVRSTFRPR